MSQPVKNNCNYRCRGCFKILKIEVNCAVVALLVAMKTCAWIILVLYVQVYDSLVERTFRCNNGEYISKAWYCDGRKDCSDESDGVVATGCWPKTCGSGKFRCEHDDWRCLDAAMRCNTVKDCNNGEDESHCGDEVNVGDCKWHDKKYLCDDKLRCLDIELTCNGECNCFDCSDEKENCWNDLEIFKVEKYRKTTSNLACFRTPLSPHCCSENDFFCHECSQNSCEQKCIQFRQEQKCFCDENYSGVMGTDNSKCVSNESKTNLLLYSTKQEIGVMNLYTNKSHVIINKIEATSVTGAFGHVYFATYNNDTGSIFKIMNGSDKISKIITSNAEVTNLAIDWITNNTYFSTMYTIYVCSENGDICWRLKDCYVLSMGLAPRFGLMFWVMRGFSSTQHIMKSDMDGSNEKLLTVYEILFTETVQTTIQITVDELSEKIYSWKTGSELLCTSFNEGSNYIVQVISYHLPAAFTVFERNVYFVNDVQNKWRRTNNIRVSNINTKPIDSSKLMTCDNSTLVTHLYAYNPKLQRTNIPNPCVESCPNSLCLIRPTSSRQTLDYTCVNENLIRPRKENSSAEESSMFEILHSTTETEQSCIPTLSDDESYRILNDSLNKPAHPMDAPKEISRTEENSPIDTPHSTDVPKKTSIKEDDAPINTTYPTEAPKQNLETERISIGAVVTFNVFVSLSIVLCAVAVIFFYLNKGSFFRKEWPIETATPLQPLISNQILADVTECSELDKGE